MPDQKEHEKLENLVDQPGQAEKSARSLQDAVGSHGTLEGFEAMNNERFSPELVDEASTENPEEREKGHPVPENTNVSNLGEAEIIK